MKEMERHRLERATRCAEGKRDTDDYAREREGRKGEAEISFSHNWEESTVQATGDV